MKKSRKMDLDPDLLDEYDFSKGQRGKYADQYVGGTNLVALAPDVAEVFPDSESVNEASRLLAKLARQQASQGLT